MELPVNQGALRRRPAPETPDQLAKPPSNPHSPKPLLTTVVPARGFGSVKNTVLLDAIVRMRKTIPKAFMAE